MEKLLHAKFGVFDALGDFDLLFASEQRDLAHLLEVHPNRIVEDIELLVLGVLGSVVGGLLVLEAIDL